MNIQELRSFRLSDAVKFHDQLNPLLFDGDKLDPQVREQLLAIAQDFMEHMGLDELKVSDIRLYGSNAAYSYTPHSDIDLHILVDMSKISNDEVYAELFNAKKTVYNDSHDITVHDIPVELYIQDDADVVKSLGEYSVMRDQWVKFPVKRRAELSQHHTRQKYQKLLALIKLALKSSDLEQIENLIWTLKRYRQAGLSAGGEFSPENVAYKALRNRKAVDALYRHRDRLHSKDLSIIDEPGTKKDSLNEFDPGEDGLSPFKLFKGDRYRYDLIDTFNTLQDAREELEFQRHLGADSGRVDYYKIEDATGRQVDGFDPDEAYDAMTSNIQYRMGQPKESQQLEECSGYIPSESERDDPRWERALSVDVHPNTMKQQVKAMGLGNITRAGIPPTLRVNGKTGQR